MSQSNTKEFQLYVNYVSDYGCFLNINGQHHDHTSALIDELLSNHSNHLKSQRPISASGIYEGMMCVAIYTDKFHRATIVNLMHLCNGEVGVSLIDLGIIKNVNLTHLRYIDNCDPRLKELAPLAKNYLLARIIHPDGKWTSNEISKMNSSFKGTVFQAVTEMETPVRSLISLYLNGDELSASLVMKKFAMTVPLEVQMYNIQMWHHCHINCPDRVSLLISNPHTIEDLPSMPVARPTKEDIPFPTVSPPRNRVLELNSEHSVIVTYRNSGPDLFVVQLKNEIVNFYDFTRDINAVEEILPQPPVIGYLCLARMSQCDFNICRVIVVNIFPAECEVYAIDFGYTELVSYCSLFTMSQRFTRYDAFAVRFSLKGGDRFVKGDHLNSVFKRLLKKKTLHLKVLSAVIGNGSVQSAELYIKGKNVLELLAKEMENQTFTELHFLKYSPTVAVVTHIESCNNFYIQLRKNTNQVLEISEAVEKHCQRSPPPSKVAVGTACCAKSSDGNWYRAKVLSIQDDKVDVQFVDYGRDEKVEISNLKCVTPELMKWPMQAIKCVLNVPGIDSADEKITDEFKTLVSCKILMVERTCREPLNPFDHKDETKYVVIHETNKWNDLGININIAISEFHAGPSQLYVTPTLYYESQHSEDSSDTESNGTEENPDIETSIIRNLHLPVPLNTPFKRLNVKKALQYRVTVSWVDNPLDFYVTITALVPKFQEMMNKIPEMYKGVSSIKGRIPLNASVLARYSDGLLYRATVESIDDDKRYTVRYVDFGNKMTLKRNELWQLDAQLMTLPAVTVRCSLSGIKAAGETWNLCREMAKCFGCDVINYKCVFNEIGTKSKVSLYHDDISLANKLVEKGFAINVY